MATTAEKLATLEAKLEQLLTGSLRTSVKDGESEMKFNPVDESALLRQISVLKSQLKAETTGTGRRRPGGVIF